MQCDRLSCHFPSFFDSLVTTGGADHAVFQWRFHPQGNAPSGPYASDDQEVRYLLRFLCVCMCVCVFSPFIYSIAGFSNSFL